jgi:integrase
MARGVYIARGPSERLTLKAALERYLREVTPTKRASTQQSERKKARPLLLALGNYSLAAITPDVVAKYRDARLGAGKANNTARLELALLSHLYNTATREWRIGLMFNPVTSIRKPSPGAGRTRRLQEDEEQRLLAAADGYSNPMMGWIVRLALYTGMRAGEILSLRRGQVDLNRRIVRLEDTKNGSSRTVPLSKKATDVFRDALTHPLRPIDCDLLFFGEAGRDGKRRPYQFTVAWHRFVVLRAGLTGFRFHDLRHEAVSRLVEAGLSDQEVLAIQVTPPIDVGTRGEPRVLACVVAHLAMAGKASTRLPANDQVGEDGVLEISGDRVTLQIVTATPDALFWSRVATGGGEVEADLAEAASWIHTAISKKARLYTGIKSSMLLAVDVAHMGVLAGSALGTHYLQTYGDPTTHFEFGGIWIVGPTENHVLRLGKSLW